MNPANRQAVFRVTIPSNYPTTDPLDLWQAGTAAALPGQETPAGGVWRADFPVDAQDAAQVLENQALLQQQTRQVLEAVPRRLQLDLLGQPEKTSGQAYGLLAGQPAGANLTILQARAYAQPGSSFSVMDDRDVNGVVRLFGQFTQQVQSLTGQFALVESAMGGRALGVTRVSWSGGISTYWSSGAGEPEARLHNLLLHTALATRQDWLRLLSLLTAAILRVSTALTLTPFLPLTIWTAWKYTQEILEEYRHLQPLSAQPMLDNPL